MPKEYLVIMPTYNEIANLEHSTAELFKFNKNVDLLIVDDNSPDGTGALADQIAKKNKNVTVLHRQEKSGLGPAYLAGFEFAFKNDFKYVVEMDADSSHRAADLPLLIAQSKNADLVIGSRWISGGRVVNWPAYRKAISKFGNWYTRVMLKTSVRDMTAGFRIYRTEKLLQIDLPSVKSEGYCFQIEMTKRMAQINGTILEVPITFVERKYGVSKMSKKIVFEAIYRVTAWGLGAKFRRKGP